MQSWRQLKSQEIFIRMLKLRLLRIQCKFFQLLLQQVYVNNNVYDSVKAGRKTHAVFLPLPCLRDWHSWLSTYRSLCQHTLYGVIAILVKGKYV